MLVEDGTVVAGSVLFSFTRFHERFGMNMDPWIHGISWYIMVFGWMDRWIGRFR